MILYEFICHDCGRQFEELIASASEESTVLCPACRSANVKRMLSAVKSRAGDAGQRGATQAPSCSPSGFS